MDFNLYLFIGFTLIFQLGLIIGILTGISNSLAKIIFRIK